MKIDDPQAHNALLTVWEPSVELGVIQSDSDKLVHIVLYQGAKVRTPDLRIVWNWLTD